MNAHAKLAAGECFERLDEYVELEPRGADAHQSLRALRGS